MKTIIAPTDFSSASLNAVNYAADLANNIHANLLLVYIIEMPVTEVPLTQDNYEALVEEAKDELRRLQAKLDERAAQAVEINIYASLGMLVTELNNLCSSYQPFAVVMGTEERGAIEKIFIGQSTTALLHHFNAPLLVVPGNAVFKSIKKICLACDLKEINSLPLQQVKQIATAFDAKLDVVHVCKNEKEKTMHLSDALLVEQKLRDMQARVYLTISNNIEAGVTAFAESHTEDILLVIPKKRPFIESLLHKSHAKRISAHPTLPVINIVE